MSRLILAALIAPLALATLNVSAATAGNTVDPNYRPKVRPVRPYSPPLGPTIVTPNKNRCYQTSSGLVCK